MSFQHIHRQALIKAIPQSLILAVSAPETFRNSDVHHAHRQDSDFLYLTGIEQPGFAVLIDTRAKRSHIFVPDLDLKHQIWVGRQQTPNEVAKKYKFESAHPISQFKKIFTELKRKTKSIHTLPTGTRFLKSQNCDTKIQDPKILRHHLNELRVRKNAHEIELMVRANTISHQGQIAAIKHSKSGIYEYQVQAILECEFKKRGATHNAYSSIVGAGANAAILHYHDNNSLCRAGDLLLIDAGCEIQGYASDITRTFPISKKFTAAQAEIYDLVLNVQNTAIQNVRPGLTMLDLHLAACRQIAEGLRDIGIFKNVPTDELIESRAFALFFPHGLGHLLGLDVHDVGASSPLQKAKKTKKGITLRTQRQLEKDFVITIEPGIYFIDAHFKNAETRKKYSKYVNWSVAEKFKSVGGIRIEDDILVTKNGHKNLTTVPKNRKDLEKLKS